MKASRLLFTVLVGTLALALSVEGWAFGRVGDYVSDFYGGAKDMWRNYNDMKDAKTIGGDKYFHAKGNYEAANRGPGGKHAATIISNAREGLQLLKPGKSWGDKWADMKADQAANKWGRNGGDPNKYRPNGLDPKYRK